MYSIFVDFLVQHMHWHIQHHDVDHCHFVHRHQFFQFFVQVHHFILVLNFHLLMEIRQQTDLHQSDCNWHFLYDNNWIWLSYLNFYHDFNEVEIIILDHNNSYFLDHSFMIHCQVICSLIVTFEYLKVEVVVFDNYVFHLVCSTRLQSLQTCKEMLISSCFVLKEVRSLQSIKILSLHIRTRSSIRTSEVSRCP